MYLQNFRLSNDAILSYIWFNKYILAVKPNQIILVYENSARLNVSIRNRNKILIYLFG